MIKLIAVAIVLLGICFFGMAIRIIFHRSHKFPQTEVGHNAQMRKMGISCPKHDELKCFGKNGLSNCSKCSLEKGK